MASQVQIPFEGVILQEHSAPISCPTPNFAKGSLFYLRLSVLVRNAGWSRCVANRHFAQNYRETDTRHP